MENTRPLCEKYQETRDKKISNSWRLENFDPVIEGSLS